MKRITLLFLSVLCFGVCANAQSTLKALEVQNTNNQITEALKNEKDLQLVHKALKSSKLSQTLGETSKTLIAPVNSTMRSLNMMEASDMSYAARGLLTEKRLTPEGLASYFEDHSGAIRHMNQNNEALDFFSKNNTVMIKGLAENPVKIQRVINANDGVIYIVK